MLNLHPDRESYIWNKQTTILHFMGVVMISEFLKQSGEICNKIFLVYFGIFVQKHCSYTSCQLKFPRTLADLQLPFCFIWYLLQHLHAFWHFLNDEKRFEFLKYTFGQNLFLNILIFTWRLNKRCLNSIQLSIIIEQRYWLFHDVNIGIEEVYIYFLKTSIF